VDLGPGYGTGDLRMTVIMVILGLALGLFLANKLFGGDD
jgi:hypothetical protein